MTGCLKAQVQHLEIEKWDNCEKGGVMSSRSIGVHASSVDITFIV